MKTYSEDKDSGIDWIGKIPKSWQIKRLKFNTYIKGRIGWQALKTDEFVDEGPYCVTGTDFKEGIINWDSCYHVGEERYEMDKFIQLQENDLLITKDGTIGKIAIVKNLNGKACLNSGVFVTRPTNEDYITRYMYWVLNSSVFTEFINYEKKGTTISHLYQNVFERLPYPNPSLDEQKSIVSFLNDKVSKINLFINKKNVLIELLKEQRIAVINRAVTKGLNENVELKDSGIEWIGKIPKGWNCSKIKRFTRVKRGASPRPIEDPKYFDDNGEYAWVRIADVTASDRYLKNTTQRLSDLGSSLSVKINVGDLFLSIAGTVGKPIITKIKCCIHDGFVYFPDLKIDKEFLYFLFSTGRCYFGLGKLGTQLNLNTETVGGISVPLPPDKEMTEIVKFLNEETSQIDKSIDKIQKEIELLQEYKEALISESVTGKIKVTEGPS